MSTDRAWQHYGSKDPYFGVLSHDRYRRENMSELALQEFFESGEDHVQETLSACERHLGRDLPRAKALDFGCGVGRLTIPLASRFEQVVGVDVSVSMLAQAQQRTRALGLHNVSFCRSLDDMHDAPGTFSFINSYIVLQHVDPQRGLTYVHAMVRLLSAGGFGAIHVTFGRARDRARYGARSIGARVAQLIGRPLENWVRKLKRRDPRMQMNPYSLNELMFILQDCGAEAVHGQFTNHGGHLGVVLLFAKPAMPRTRPGCDLKPVISGPPELQ